MPTYCFEDFTPGHSASYGRMRVDRDELVAFSRAFDPQDFHLDEDAARQSFVGELIGSGWMTLALHHRMICDDYLLVSSSMGSPGIEEVKWLRPVKPGDVLHARRRVLTAKPSASRPDRGMVHFAQEMFNQNDEPVLFQTNWIMFGRRNPGKPADNRPAPVTGAPLVGATVTDLPPMPASAAAMPHLAMLEDVVVGSVLDLGTYTFTAEEIIAYGRRYDPQYFHIDAEAAKASHFGGLIASGWHTAGGWMRTMADDRARRTEQALAAGERPARLGPSPGFRNLKWLKPVYAGDVITYRSKLIDKRTSNSRPGWGLVFHHNTGDNQRGERVFEFNGCVFWESRRP